MKIRHPKLLKHIRRGKSYTYDQRANDHNNNKTTISSVSNLLPLSILYLKPCLNQSPQAEFARLLLEHQIRSLHSLILITLW